METNFTLLPTNYYHLKDSYLSQSKWDLSHQRRRVPEAHLPLVEVAEVAFPEVVEGEDQEEASPEVVAEVAEVASPEVAAEVAEVVQEVVSPEVIEDDDNGPLIHVTFINAGFLPTISSLLLMFTPNIVSVLDP